MIAALGPHTRAYQRIAPSVPHRHELRGHYGVHRERRYRVHGGRGGHRSDCRHSGRCARSSAAGATVALTAAPRQGANQTATVA
jgi:hypothetical protein